MIDEYILCGIMIIIAYFTIYRPARKSHNLMDKDRNLPKLKWYKWWM